MEKEIKTSIAAPATDLYSASDIEAGSIEKSNNTPSAATSWMKNFLLSVETQGIERVTDEERQENTTKVWHACTFW
jgi:hypothetical protein